MTLVRGVPLPGYCGLRAGLPAGGRLRECWTERRPDVVYVATEGPLGWSAVRTARRLGVPVLSGFHTNFHHYAGHYRAGWLRPAIVSYLRRFHNRTAGTLVASADLHTKLAAVGFNTLSILGRGVEQRAAHSGQPIRGAPRSLGRLRPRGGHPVRGSASRREERPARGRGLPRHAARAPRDAICPRRGRTAAPRAPRSRIPT